MSGVPYIGSRISLISKAGIRYEGILYTIDAKEATVALSTVRSFGTEDRQTERPVPPREEVYEYIIFRGTDIKDLHVCEPPKQMSLPVDPAIVKSSQPIVNPNTGYPQQPPVTQPGVIGGGPGAGGYPGFNMPPYVSHQPPHVHPTVSQQSSHPPPVQASRGSTPPPNRKSPTNDQGTQVARESPNKDKRQQQHHHQKENVAPHHNEREGYHQQRHQSGHSGGNHPGNHPSHGGQHGQHSQYNNQNQNQSYRGRQRGGGERGGPRGGGFYNNRGYSAYRGQGPPQRRPRRGGPVGFGRPKSEPLTFDGDFDFETSNAQFDKEQLEKELKEKCNISGTSTSEKVVNGDKPEGTTTTTGSADEAESDELYYDKSRSFFDNISCEASERAKGVSQRPNWREERKMNAETFGISSTRELNRYRYRGSPRGRGGYRGRGRGRGGYPAGRGRGGGGGGGRPQQQQPQQVAAQS